MPEESPYHVDPEATILKAQYRISLAFLTFQAQYVLKTPFVRERPEYQGASAEKKGFHAAHASLLPSTSDAAMPTILKSIRDKGLTPERSKPFLTHRINLTSPEARLLQNATSPEAREFVGNRLPKGGLKSSFLGTWASFFNNTTVDAPAESNRFDMRLEKDFGEIVEMLALQVADRSMSSVDATQRLKEHLKGFYATSVENLTIRLEQIEEFIVY